MRQLKRDLHSLPVSWLGRLLYFLIPKKHSIARKNIERVFHAKISSYEKKRLIIAYYSHLVLCIKEIIMYRFLSKKYLNNRVKLIGVDYLYQALAKNKGVLILTGHLGSWEFAPLFFLEQIKKGDHLFYCIRKPLRFSFLNSIFWARFENAGFKIISRNSAISESITALKNKNVVFFPFDLRAPDHTKSSINTLFLGQQSKTYISIAQLAYRLNCPVLSVSFYRVNKKQHVIQFYPEISSIHNANRKQMYLENTAKYNQRLEEMLLAFPEQWLWSYKRW